MAEDCLFWFPRILTFEYTKTLMTSCHIVWLLHFKRAMLPEDWTQLELSDLLDVLRNRKCSDPRDKIIALLGILDVLLRLSKSVSSRYTGSPQKEYYRLPNLDYSQSVAHVYKRVVSWTLSSRQDAKILYLACFSSSEVAERSRLATHITPDLPSWVPDLQYLSHLQRPYITHPRALSSSEKQLYSACSSAPFCLSLPWDDTICLKGILCATVDYIGSEALPLADYDYNAGKAARHLYDVVNTWVAECKQFCQLNPYFESLVKLARGLTQIVLNGAVDKFEAVVSKYFALLVRMAEVEQNRKKDSKGNALDDGDPAVLEIDHQFGIEIGNRTLLISEQGPLGTGFGHFQLGDHIFAAAGFEKLLILRPSGDCYILVGHAYMEGFMQGESWPKDERDLQDIKII